jgi:hypothetical protein
MQRLTDDCDRADEVTVFMAMASAAIH